MEHVGKTIDVTIIRDKVVKDIDIPMHPFITLVPPQHHFNKPPYYIFGGLVFTVLSRDLLESWGSRWWEKAPLDLAYYAIGTGRLNDVGRQEVVVLLSVLPDDINVGYHGLGNDVVSRVNGRQFTSFKDFVSMVDEVQRSQPYTIFETEHKSRLILGNEGIEQVNNEILKRNNIPYQFSDDVADWLNKPKI
jgi:hypothetical protein